MNDELITKSNELVDLILQGSGVVQDNIGSLIQDMNDLIEIQAKIVEEFSKRYE